MLYYNKYVFFVCKRKVYKSVVIKQSKRNNSIIQRRFFLGGLVKYEIDDFFCTEQENREICVIIKV